MVAVRVEEKEETEEKEEEEEEKEEDEDEEKERRQEAGLRRGGRTCMTGQGLSAEQPLGT